MTKQEYEDAFITWLENKSAYVGGRLPVPPNVARILAAFYMWPYPCDICDDGVEDRQARLEAMTSHEGPV